MLVNISGARSDEALEGLGARLLEGPIQIPNGPRIAFLWAPDDVRVELIERRKSGVTGGC